MASSIQIGGGLARIVLANVQRIYRKNATLRKELLFV